MPRINWPKNVLAAFWAVMEGDAALVETFGGKWVRRQMSIDEITMERAPFLGAWLTVPLPVWWAAQATKITLEIDVIGVVVTGNREDADVPTMAFVNFTGALEEDLVNMEHSHLRDDALVTHFEYLNPAFLYGRQIETSEGVYLIQSGLRFHLKNPNC